MATWPEVLDEIEERNEKYRKFLESGSGELPCFLPPTDVGPLPPELQARAKALLDETHELEARASEMRDSVASLLLPTSGGYANSLAGVFDELA